VMEEVRQQGISDQRPDIRMLTQERHD
jgi:hypothetical protein